MTTDLFDPPALELGDDALERRRIHLLAEIGRPPKRRRRLLAAVLAAAAAVAIALATLLGGRPATTRLTLVDQALAAIGSGPTIHVVLRMQQGVDLFDPRTGTTTPLPIREEFWADPRLGTLFVQSLGTRIAQRVVFGHSSWVDAAAAWRPFVTGYRAQLEHGTFRVVARGRVDGRSVDWIANRTPPRNGRSVEQIAVSTTTYRPVALRYLVNGRVVPQMSAQVVLAETLPRRPPLFVHARSMPQFGGGQTSYPGGGTGIPTTLAAARAAMSPDPIVPPRTIGGLHRSWIGLPDYLLPPANSYKDQVNGLRLYYGRLDGYGDPSFTGRYVAINEIPRRADADAIWGQGYFRAGRAVVVTPGSKSETTATIELRGLSVAIQASDRATAIAAVRALR
jgi:hypothetical protein